MQRYAKAIAAFLTTAAALVANFVPAVEAVTTPEVIDAVAVIAATALVYAIPNRET